MKTPILYIVVPCYNEEQCLKETIKQLSKKNSELKKAGKINSKSCLVFVDDGSNDATWKIIDESKEHDIVGLKLSRNRGHQNALLAGLMYAKEYADAVVTVDADLQHDINAIDEMLAKFSDGYEIIYGVRKERKQEKFFKRTTAQGFYKIMNFMGVDLIYNSADYRLMSKRALDELANYKEVNLFLRGIVPLIGLKWTVVKYDQHERFAGESKYTLSKMLNLAWDGITSFTVKPLRFVLALGILTFIASFIIMLYSVIQHFCGNTVDGWTFTVCSIWLVGGLQMVCTGLIGEYIGKIYAETKQRPRYCIEQIVIK